MLKAVGLWKEYEGPRGKLHILRGVELEIEAGDLTFVIGRSGAGKSTLLHLLGGLDRPTGGSVEFKGEDLNLFNEESLAEYRNKRIGFVFQKNLRGSEFIFISWRNEIGSIRKSKLHLLCVLRGKIPANFCPGRNY